MACAREAENVALRLVGARQMPLGLASTEGLWRTLQSAPHCRTKARAKNKTSKRVFGLATCDLRLTGLVERVAT